MPASHGSRPEYEVSMWPLNISVLPPPVPAPRADDVGPAVLDLLPLHLQAHLVEDPRHVLGHRLLRPRRAGDVDQRARRLDEAAPVDLDARAPLHLHDPPILVGRVVHDSGVVPVEPGDRLDRPVR